MSAATETAPDQVEVASLSDFNDNPAFLIPSPIEVFLLVAAGWAGACFMLMVASDRIMLRIMRFSSVVANLISDIDLVTVLPVLVVGGLAGIGFAFWVLSRSDKWFISVVFLAFAFGDCTWVPLHYVAMYFKYMAIAYLGSFGVFFVYRNWNRIRQRIHWLMIFYLLWMAFVVYLYGMRTNGNVHVAIQFAIIVAFCIGWMSRIDNYKKLMDFNFTLAYVAIAVTCLHAISPLTGVTVFADGRFISMFRNATGYSTTYALFVVCLIWLALAHPTKVMRNVATVFAIAGFGMVLLSGTRNASAAVVCAIILLSITFRSKLIWYALGIGGFLGAVIFLVLSSSTTEVTSEAGRLGTITNTRLDVWTAYFFSIWDHPFIGYGPGGHSGAFFGAKVQEFADIYTGMAFAPAVHNAILAQAVSYGLVGLGLFLSIFVYAFWHAKDIVLDTERRIPQEYKVALAMPLAILVTLFLEGAFEDNFGTTRGSVDYLLFYSTALLVGLFAKRFGKDAAERLDADASESVSGVASPRKLVRI